MHLQRITEWQMHDIVHWHTAGYKSLYFFAYSLVGWLAPVRLLFWVNIYHATICLLLSWQYYRLACEVGLSRRWARLFVLLHALLFGNFCFSFFRYYSLASTIFAQLGAIALIRLAVSWAKTQKKRQTYKKHSTRGNDIRGGASCLSSRRLLEIALCLFKPSFLARTAIAALLALLVASNHLQGLGIAILGCASIAGWRGVQYQKPFRAWVALVVTVVVCSATFYYFWPRSPNFAAVALVSRWLTPWQGLNFFPPDGTAYPRAIAIMGAIGLLNLAAGFSLFIRRKLAGWLTVGPIILLALPCAGVPLADLFARGDKDIITFPRMLFSVPTGLALVTVLREITCRVRKIHRLRANKLSVSQTPLIAILPLPLQPLTTSVFSSFATLLITLLLFTTLPASHPWHNRFWHALARPAPDLSLELESSELAILIPSHSAFCSPVASPPLRIGSTTPIIRLLNIQVPQTEHVLGWKRTPDKRANGNAWFDQYSVSGRAPVEDYTLIIWPACSLPPTPRLLTIPATRFFTPCSQAAQNSGHWNPSDALFSTSGMPELVSLASQKKLSPNRIHSGMVLWEPVQCETLPPKR
jgi:hypothetical protein